MTDTAASVEIEALRRLPKPALWVIAARLKTLSLSIMPVLAGTWYAARHGGWRLDVLVAALVAAVAIQIGTNLWNDAADAARGVDTGQRLGPPRVTALGLLSPRAVRQAARITFLVAGLAGLWLAAIGGWPIVLIGAASLLLGYAYSMGPLPLSMTPVGELLVILFFGTIAVAGTHYLHSGGFDSRAASLGTIFGLPAAAVLLLNNHRDRLTDRAAGRRTLAILLGETLSRALFGLLLLVAVAALVWWAAPMCGPSWAGASVALCYAVFVAVQLGCAPISREINGILPKTALVQVVMLLFLVADGTICSH